MPGYKDWIDAIDIKVDYFSAFMKAWIAFNAWYNFSGEVTGKMTSVLASGQNTKQIGAYNFVNDARKISEAIVIILYMLRCCLAHGDISPDESANEVYKYAYEVLCAPLRKLK